MRFDALHRASMRTEALYRASVRTGALYSASITFIGNGYINIHDGKMPYVIVGDEAFPLKRYMMRPYPGRGLSESERIFNYRLSRARRCSENAFGILSSRWRIFHRTMDQAPETVDELIKATVVLHNF